MVNVTEVPVGGHRRYLVQPVRRVTTELLSTNGIVSQNTEAYVDVSGIIESISPVVLEGTTHYYICIKGNENILMWICRMTA